MLAFEGRVIVAEGHTGPENTAPTCGRGDDRIVAAAADATLAHRTESDLGHVTADPGHAIADLGHRTGRRGRGVAVPGRETEVDRAAVTRAEIETVPRGTGVAGCRVSGSVREQLGQGRGQGQGLSCVQGRQGECRHTLYCRCEVISYHM